ncbi:hypothetical protein KAR91_59865 [Candidatus Pacearchaeota archaeon]|nr:hypothetical protein [Candidatus Pacearchaeota archaeon]
MDTTLDATHGSGGGGGSGSGSGGGPGGDGGGYGAGGAGNDWAAGGSGTGTQGIIVITYTPSGAPPASVGNPYYVNIIGGGDA